MKIGILGIRGLPPNYGGFETCAKFVSKHWARQGNHVLVYCRSHLYQEKMETYNGCRLKFKNAFSNQALDTLSHTLKSVIDLIFFEKSIKYVHMYNGGNAIFIPLLKAASKKVIISIDGIEWKRQKWGGGARTMHKLGEYFAVKFADAVIADNLVVQQYYKIKYNRDVELIPYGAEPPIETKNEEEEKLLKQYGLKSKNFFLFVGRFVPEKGIHNLLHAYNKIKAEIPLVLIGGSDDKAYVQKLKSMGDNRVKYLGYVYGRHYQIVLKNALVYVSASELEGTSPSLLAAMGARVCVLVNGIEENVASIGNNGIYSRKNDFDDFSKKWQTLMDVPERIEHFAEKGFRHVQKNYRWQKIADDYLSVFRKL